MTLLQAASLGLIQGLTEFLPVSSSAHLALSRWLLGWPDPGLTFDVALHAGTLVAVVAYFWRDWLDLLTGAASRPAGPQGRLLALLVLGSVPAAAAGLALEDVVEARLRGPYTIAALLIAFALLMEAADRFGRRARELADLTWAGALIIGCAQALALAPGVSRSGVTLTAALALGLTRPAAARFSFLLSTPIIVGACALKLRHLTGADLTPEFWTGVAVSAASGLAAVSALMSRLRTNGLTVFTAYRLALGALLLIVALSRSAA